MRQERRVRILEKLAFDWPFQWSRDADKARVQRTVDSARRNYEAGGTVEQRQINDSAGSFPANLTLKDRLKDWTTRQVGPKQPWTPGTAGPAPIFQPPQDLGNPRANRALQLLRQNPMTGFGPPAKGYTDCSTFACNVAQAPHMTTDYIYSDARGKKKSWIEIPHWKMRPGDFLVYPSHEENGDRDYGHIAMYAGAGRVIDSSASGSGVRYRQVPPAFYTRAEAGDAFPPIVVRARRDMSAPRSFIPPIPMAGTPLVFQEGQYTPRRGLGALSPLRGKKGPAVSPPPTPPVRTVASPSM